MNDSTSQNCVCQSLISCQTGLNFDICNHEYSFYTSFPDVHLRLKGITHEIWRENLAHCSVHYSCRDVHKNYTPFSLIVTNNDIGRFPGLSTLNSIIEIATSSK